MVHGGPTPRDHSIMNFLTASINHLCHRIFPYLIIGFLLFQAIGFTSWPPYVIMGLIIFIDRYSYKIGYFSSLLQNNNTNIEYIITNEKESKVEEQD